MPHAATVPAARLVLDTNIWLDWLVFDDAGVVPVKDAVTRGAAAVFISAACVNELRRVLGYTLSGRVLDAQAQAAALAQCLTLTRAAETCREPHIIGALPKCADPDDQMFLELARDCRADVLITRDRDLLAIAARKVQALPFRILTPREFARDAPGL
jgi:uncharacterized protein